MTAIQEKTYGDFSQVIHTQAMRGRLPMDATIEVTRRCPLTCSHCYNNLPMNDAAARAGELTLEEHKRLVDELEELGCLWILYTGGEIFARRDFLDIYEYARRRGFLVTLFTNATLITETIADRLAALPPMALEVTLYGRTQETYEKLTGIPGSWKQAMRGIELILDRKLPLKLKTVAVSVNVHELDAIRQFAEELRVEFKFDAMMNPRIDCSSSPLEVRLTPAEVVALDLSDPARAAEWHRLGTFTDPEPEAVPDIYDCGGGVNSFAIDPTGAMTICTLSHQESYDLRKGSVRDGWFQFLHSIRARKATRVTKCTFCSLRSLCGSCAANGELENGDPESPVEFLCQTAHLRAKLFDVPVKAHGDCEYCPGGSDHHHLLEQAEEVKRLAASGVIMQRPQGGEAASGCGTGACGGCSSTKWK